jgi:hypothetical protein
MSPVGLGHCVGKGEQQFGNQSHSSVTISESQWWRVMLRVYSLQQPWRPRYTFLAPSVSTLFESIININSNFKTKNIFECLSTVKYFHNLLEAWYSIRYSLKLIVVVVVVVVVGWRPHLHRHQWIVPEYTRTLDSTGLQCIVTRETVLSPQGHDHWSRVHCCRRRILGRLGVRCRVPDLAKDLQLLVVTIFLTPY